MDHRRDALSGPAERVRSSTNSVFASWRARVAERLRGEGVDAEQAARLAVFAVAALEGAILLARNNRDGPEEI
jgi:TetR/AcrR family transcriptional repressor of lmrAB and yxaGH operons